MSGLNVETLTAVLTKLRYPPTRQVNGSQSGASWFEPDYRAHASNIAREYGPVDAADLARWLQDTIESQPAITIRQGVEPQVAWRALADELLRRWR